MKRLAIAFLLSIMSTSAFSWDDEHYYYTPQQQPSFSFSGPGISFSIGHPNTYVVPITPQPYYYVPYRPPVVHYDYYPTRRVRHYDGYGYNRHGHYNKHHHGHEYHHDHD